MSSTNEQALTSFGTDTSLPPKLLESSPLSLALLSAALDDPQSGLIIFDEQFRVVHITSHAPSLLELSSQSSIEGLTLLDVLERSKLDPESLRTARECVTGFEASSAAQSLVLQNPHQSRGVRMRIRNVVPGYRVATFEPVVPSADSSPVRAAMAADALTGLASRQHLEDRMMQLFKSGSDAQMTLFLLNLDRFKAVNETLGLPAGDTVLRLAAERLRSAVRKEDLIARLGADEFAVLMHPAASLNETVAVAQRILDLIQRTYLIHGQLVNVGVGIGIAQSPADGQESPSLMRSADLALRHAKSSGRSSYHFFEESMERRAQKRRANELELRRALALKQLELFYQAQIDTNTGRLVGFEALVRWRHPERGLIPPGDFLPIAEEIGLMVPIGDWVLRTACREALKWPAEITVAVNASPLQFDTGKFAESVRRALESTGLPGERLEVEITEGIMLRNDNTVMRTLEELRAMRVRIAMDDFGTGYASLSQLARFPFDKIKIDRSLAGVNGDNPKQRSIVRAITALGESLGVSTLAEGVEDAQQLARLKVDGCTSIQGYLFSKPVPTSQIQEVLERFSPQIADVFCES